MNTIFRKPRYQMFSSYLPKQQTICIWDGLIIYDEGKGPIVSGRGL